MKGATDAMRCCLEVILEISETGNGESGAMWYSAENKEEIIAFCFKAL